MEIDHEKRRVLLSLKQAGVDPWIGAERKYARGTLVDATVRSIVEYGAFVEIEKGVEGLVHISELADRRVKNVEEVLDVGQSAKLRVLEVDEQQRRIRLSLKAVDHFQDDRLDDSTPDASTHPGGRAKPKKPSRPLKGGIE